MVEISKLDIVKSYSGLDLDYFLQKAQDSYLFKKRCIVYLESKLSEMASADESKKQYALKLLKKNNPDIKELFRYLRRAGLEINLEDMWRNVRHL